jgi:hypothetical protein
MHIKIYVPKTVEIPSEYLSPLAQRASDSMGESARGTPATRGHLVRQAVRDGLLRELDSLLGADGAVDVFCDPHSEIPLEIDSHTFSLVDLRAALGSKRQQVEQRPADGEMPDLVVRPSLAPKRKAA